MRVLYLYSGLRKNKFKGEAGKDYPDTQLYGLNHLGEFGVAAEYKEFGDLANRLLGFRLRHLLSYFLTPGYDLVFGSSLLFSAVFKKIFRPRRKFVLLNIGLNRTFLANKKGLKSKIINWLLAEIDAIVCLSGVQRDYLVNKFPELKNKLYFIPLGVDVEYYQPQFDNRKNYILSAGRDNGRDYKTVVETAKLLPEEEFQIVCSERNLQGVKEIPDNVKIFYDLPAPELNKKYHEAKMLLLITHDDNSLGGSDCSGQTVLLDAMASGLPVIASRKKYLADYVIDGWEFLSVDFYGAADIAEKIKIFNETDFREKIAKNARIRVERQFSTRQLARGLAETFKKITGQS
ncbi:MAG: glycosyltransferase family 4 protein [Candidatus Portnoybacteria bacterium]|nr:glycosyltransferase family 4 protein [Candidatus Portnoybacteria bacterium]MDD4982492.1 glycosyltransferase family 4 protein [Candidatus Portnoybacteria bacterium]